MPVWKYAANRLLTALQNRIYGTHMSEFHSGLRVYTASLLRTLPRDRCLSLAVRYRSSRQPAQPGYRSHIIPPG